MNDIGTLLTLIGMALMVGSLYEHQPTMDEFCDIAARLRNVYRVDRRIAPTHRDALSDLHTIQ